MGGHGGVVPKKINQDTCVFTHTCDTLFLHNVSWRKGVPLHVDFTRTCDKNERRKIHPEGTHVDVRSRGPMTYG